MDFKLYLSMNSVAIAILFLCCLMIQRCFSLKKYAFPFSFGVCLIVTILLESSMVGFILVDVAWMGYILLPLCYIGSIVSTWAGVLTFSQLAGGRFLKSKKTRILLLTPAIIPVIVYIIELSMGAIDFSKFNNSVSDFAKWSSLSNDIVSTAYLFLGICILVFSLKKLMGIQKRLVTYYAISLGLAFAYNLSSYVTNLSLEYIWAPYAFACLFVLLCTLRLSITRDGLTQIKNRVGFERDIKFEVNYTRRKNSLFLIVADIDDFKMINDTLGHGAGDKALVIVSNIVSQKAQDIRATAYRIGGDEFAIVFPDHRRLDVEEYMMVVNNAIRAAEGSNNMTLSMGICEYKKGSDLKDFLAKADRKMYEQKQLRKNKQI